MPPGLFLLRAFSKKRVVLRSIEHISHVNTTETVGVHYDPAALVAIIVDERAVPALGLAIARRFHDARQLRRHPTHPCSFLHLQYQCLMHSGNYEPTESMPFVTHCQKPPDPPTPPTDLATHGVATSILAALGPSGALRNSLAAHRRLLTLELRQGDGHHGDDALCGPRVVGLRLVRLLVRQAELLVDDSPTSRRALT